MSEEELNKQTNEDNNEKKQHEDCGCEGKNEKECKHHFGHHDEEHKCMRHKVEELEAETKRFEHLAESKDKELKDALSKANQYLATASYYKNELDTQKKDFERYKERNKNLEEELKQKANEEFVKKILPILDNFEQAFANVDEQISKGFEMIYKSLQAILTSVGVVEIDNSGELNPEFHNCIATEVTNDENLDGKIAKVYQKGYMFEATGKVVRTSTCSVYAKA